MSYNNEHAFSTKILIKKNVKVISFLCQIYPPIHSMTNVEKKDNAFLNYQFRLNKVSSQNKGGTKGPRPQES